VSSSGAGGFNLSGSDRVGGSDPLRNKDFDLFRIEFPFNAELDRNFGKILRDLRKI
jgi:hypothetical protein